MAYLPFDCELEPNETSYLYLALVYVKGIQRLFVTRLGTTDGAYLS